MTERLALLPLTGAGERTCDGCQACLPVETGSGAECGMHGDGIRPHELLIKQRRYLRLPQCLSAEREAARLRAVEGAARSYVTTGTQSAWSNHALHKLRVALEER